MAATEPSLRKLTREMVLRGYDVQYTYQEIADKTGWSVPTVCRELKSALLKILRPDEEFK